MIHETGVSTAAPAWGIFHEPWWLDAVSADRWEEAVVERDGAVVARLPYVRRRRMGLETTTSPPLTPRLGPWLDPSVPSRSVRRSLDTVEDLIRQLPATQLFTQNFSPDFGLALPFHWHGYTEKRFYSHVITQLGDEGSMLRRMPKDRRRALRDWHNRIGVEPVTDAGHAYRLIDLSHRHRGASFDVDRTAFERALDESTARGRGATIGAFVPGRRQPVAVLVTVWDQRRTYALAGGLDREHAPAGAAVVLDWQAIQAAATTSERFDFEGSMIPGIAHYMSGFPGHPEPYSHVERRTVAASSGIVAVKAAARLRRRWIEAAGGGADRAPDATHAEHR